MHSIPCRYAVTTYAAQGKTVDYVLFSDSAVKAASLSKLAAVQTRPRAGPVSVSPQPDTSNLPIQARKWCPKPGKP